MLNRAKLLAIFDDYGLALDCERITAGRENAGFRTFEAGTGVDYNTLRMAKNAIDVIFGKSNFNSIDTVNNPSHPQYGKFYLNVESFWVANN